MALLQIAEPGLSAAPHEHRLAVGIDLGTTHSLVASVRSGQAQCLADESGRVLLPSVVRYIGEGQTEVGADALKAQTIDPVNTISSAKRLLGKTLAQVQETGAYLAYDFSGDERMIRLRTRNGPKSPIEVSADILGALKRRAENVLGGELVGAVITVPAYFDEAQRQATKDAARLAGLNVLRLINEPTAAAIAYGLDTRAQGTFVVYDLGGGTFDVSILKLERGLFEVRATHGDSALGGDDFDRLLYEHLLQALHLERLPENDAALLLSLARDAKETLSDTQSTVLRATLSSGDTIEYALSRAEFDALTQSLVQKTFGPLKQALKDAELTAGEVAGVIMVGGATRMPAIQKAVADFFGQAPLNNLNPDEVVALGAAIQANVLAGNKNDDEWLLLDVTPLSLGLETYGGLVEKIIPRNSTIPTARAQEFTTFKDGQTAMVIHVVQGERELVADCRSLVRLTLRGIPPMTAGAARIRVTFQVDADGLLSVSAREETTGVQAQIEVKPSYGLDDEQITRMLRESMTEAGADAHARARAEAAVEGQSLFDAVSHALAQDGDLLDKDERARIDAALAALSGSLKDAQADASRLREAAKQLGEATDSFAAQRMNRTIKQALTGKTIEEI